jgi:hypothetical protein
LHSTAVGELNLKPGGDFKNDVFKILFIYLQIVGPVKVSQANHVKLSFRHGGDEEFFKKYRDALSQRMWQRFGPPANVLTEQRASSTGFSSSAGNNQHVCSSTF